MGKIILLIVGAMIFTSCYRIDSKTYKATGYSERVRFIILHYTAIDRERSIRALTQEKVSSHYLVTDKRQDPIYQLVSLEKRAWHAGISEFAGRTNLNDSSIGIEIVNKGYKKMIVDLDMENEVKNIANRKFYPYKDYQIKKIGRLLQDLVKEYKISPKNILGHSDVAPTRKQDPGPMFPWEQLYKEYGVGAWYEDEDFHKFYDEGLYEKYSEADIQMELRRYGYGIKISGKNDGETIKVIGAFQSHFRPIRVTGEMDLETFAILKALNQKYSL
ncbi:MAG: N-acetylmuramoyl-L-alanine amidase [Psychrilyobacter sp.]|uniref:N-acetylmuramoyl-L-alanine amidase n=1 Tax=Psychrilyobacter sp. TaxID=2586924 RepID=UPI003C748AA7